MSKKLVKLLCSALVLALVASLGGVAMAEETTLYLLDGNAYALDLFDIMIDEFEKAHPGVKVEVQHAADGSETVLATRIAADDLPDVFAQSAGLALEKYREYTYLWQDDKEVLDLFQDSAIASITLSDGAILGLPDTFATPGMLYNVDVFEKAGITELPRTLSELEAACEKIKAIGVTPFALAAGSGWPLAQMAESFIAGKGIGGAAAYARIAAGEDVMSIDKNAPNLFKLLDLAVKYGPAAPLEYDWEIAENTLAAGECAMIHIGDWCYQQLISGNPDCNISMMATPTSENPDEAVTIASVAWQFMVNKNSPNLELAKELAIYTVASEAGCNFFINGQGVPCAKNNLPPANMLQEGSQKLQAQGDVVDRIMNYFPPVGDFGTVLQETLQGYMMGLYSVDEATQMINEGWVR